MTEREDLTMNMLSNAFGKLRTLLGGRAPRVALRSDAQRHRFSSPTLEPLEPREMLSAHLGSPFPVHARARGPACSPAITVQSVDLVTQTDTFRLAPDIPLHMVVRVTGTDRATGQATTLTGTALELAAQACIDVNFGVSSLDLARTIFAKLKTFLDTGVAQLRPGVDGQGVGIMAMTYGFTSRSVQLLRNNTTAALGGGNCNGAYTGAFHSTVIEVRDPEQDGPIEPIVGPVAFRVIGTFVIVTAPGPGQGRLDRSCATGRWATGGGALGPVKFTIGVRFRSDEGIAEAGGTWKLGSFGIIKKAEGAWSATRSV